MKLYDTKLNHMTCPLGFDLRRTVFSWKVCEAEGSRQEAARIRVAADAGMEQILYDSGWDPAADSLAWPVELPLRPRTRYYWTVTVRSDLGEEAESDLQWFETAKLQEPWQARWITCDSTQPRHPVFEKRIAPEKPVTRARLYVCGLGLYEAYYNGTRIGNEYLTPYCTNYNQRVQYQTFDVTQALQEAGTLSILLGNGWYRGRFGFWSKPGELSTMFGGDWKLTAELHLDFADGSHAVCGTDESWQVRRSRLTFSNLYDGEQRDDTAPELPLEAAVLCDPPAGRLTARLSPPVTPQEHIPPAALLHTPAGEQVFDLGQEITGIFRLRVHAPAGTRIHIQTGEILQEGNFYRDNLRTAQSEYIYISDGTEQILEPHFTFYGYRYAKVTGIEDLQLSDFTGIVLHTELEQTGTVETGHPLINRLIENVRWGMKGNFLDVPTDCPQRDERMGWTGDTQVFSPTAMYLADTYAFYAEYLQNLKDEQMPLDGLVPEVVPAFGSTHPACVWGDVATILPWNLYLFSGDPSILADQFDSMKAWVEYIRRLDGDNHGWRYAFHFGDWLALDNLQMGPECPQGATDEEFIASLYYAISAGIVAKAAAVLGRTEDEAAYSALSGQLFDEVRKEYYSATGRCCIKTQTALLLTLKYHLSDNEELTKQQLLKLFDNNDGKLNTGFVGTPLLGNVLSDNGMSDLAMQLLLNEEYPGWLYEVKLGATTVWERWNSVLADGSISGTGMNSLNHYAYGSILEWIFRHVAGINTQETSPGCRFIRFTPTLNWKLRHVTAAYDSPAGRYTIAWELPDPDHARLSVSVPFGGSAALELPLAPETVFADQENPLFARVEDGACLLGPGDYSVSWTLTESVRKPFSLDTSIRELMAEPEAVEALQGILDLSAVPKMFRSSSLRQMLEQSGQPFDEAGITALLQAAQEAADRAGPADGK